jgi:hypothetical protein
MRKAAFLHVAEIFDTWRVVPRILLFGYSWFVAHTTNFILGWYFQQPAAGRGTQETAVILGVFTALTGLAGWVFKVYVDNGRNWSDNPLPDDHEHIHDNRTDT